MHQALVQYPAHSWPVANKDGVEAEDIRVLKRASPYWTSGAMRGAQNIGNGQPSTMLHYVVRRHGREQALKMSRALRGDRPMHPPHLDGTPLTRHKRIYMQGRVFGGGGVASLNTEYNPHTSPFPLFNGNGVPMKRSNVKPLPLTKQPLPSVLETTHLASPNFTRGTGFRSLNGPQEGWRISGYQDVPYFQKTKDDPTVTFAKDYLSINHLPYTAMHLVDREMVDHTQRNNWFRAAKLLPQDYANFKWTAATAGMARGGH